MDTMNCVIDTNEMAVSVDGVTTHLGAATAAVVAMQAAVIKSEQDAADTICENVDKGFLTLMQSQISTKKAHHFSLLNAQLMKLMEQAKSLTNKKSRMENDVVRLQRQYYKTFHSLDQALEHRIHQLDHDSVKLAQNREMLIITHQLKDLAVVSCSGKEAANTAQMALFARIHSKTSKALYSVENNIIENEDYKTQLTELLESESVTKAELEYIPVLYVKEASIVMKDSEVSQFFIPEDLSSTSRDVIENAIRQSAESFTSLPADSKEKDEIARVFNNMTASADLDPRGSAMMMQLFTNGGC